MKKLLRGGCLCALATLASCGTSNDTTSTASQAAASTAPAASAPQQAIPLTTQGAGLVQRVNPNGKGAMVQLDGQFQSAVIARRNANGTISAECHDEQEPADAFAQGRTSPATVEVK